MRVAYVDSSVVVAIAFDEPEATRLVRNLDSFERLISSNLLEAELDSALVREGVADVAPDYLSAISWVFPNRPLTAEIKKVAQTGYLRGADLWHLACALLVSPDPGQISFLTLDDRQRKVAGTLGFKKLQVTR